MNRSPLTSNVAAAPGLGGIETVRGEWSLGSWTFDTWRPPRLAPLVDHFWAYTGPTGHPMKRVFPNGCVELLLNFAEPYVMIEGEGIERCRGAWVGGLQVGPIVIQQPPYQRVIGVRLRPAGAYAILTRSLREITGLSVELEDLVGRACDELMERCAAKQTVLERFRIVAQWIVERAAGSRAVDPAVAWSLAQLEGSGGSVSIAKLRDKTGLSKSALVNAFRAQVGAAPKLYARIVRFHRALGMLQDGGPARLTDVAMDADFYDHPHMDAEFRALGGLTPRQFLGLRHPVGDGSTARHGPPAA